MQSKNQVIILNISIFEKPERLLWPPSFQTFRSFYYALDISSPNMNSSKYFSKIAKMEVKTFRPTEIEK